MPRVALDQRAPDFSLPDFAGSRVSLSDLRGRKNVLLIFNMSDIPKNEEILSLVDPISAPTPPRDQAEPVATSGDDY